MNAAISALVTELEGLLLAGRPREAREALLERRPPLDAKLALVAAEVYAACGRPRRAAALLELAARSLGTIGTARAAARALLAAGRHRRARLVLEPHAADGAVAVLMAIARNEPVPVAALPPVDVDEVLDRALSESTPTATLTSTLSSAPTSTRARLALVARLRAEGDADGSRAVLRAGLKGREDARLELPLAMAAVDDGAWDEAALVLARARARHPDLARRADLRLLLAWVTLQAGRRDDAISTLRGAIGGSALDTALLALLDPSTVVTTAAPAAVTSSPERQHQRAPRADGPPKRSPTKAWSGPVGVFDATSQPANPFFRRVAIAVAVVIVLVGLGKTIAKRWPTGSHVVDAGPVVSDVSDVSAAAAAEFSRRASECGVMLPAVLEPGLLYAEVAARLLASGYQGGAVTAGDVVLRVDQALGLAGDTATVRLLRTTSGVTPGVVVRDETSVGLALAQSDDTPRQAVYEIVKVSAMRLAATTIRPCATANPGFVCVTARGTCQQLDFVIGAVCPESASATSDLPSCSFDVVVVRTPAPATIVDAGAVVVVDAGDVVAVDGGNPAAVGFVSDGGTPAAISLIGGAGPATDDAGSAATDAGQVDAG